MEIPSVHAAPVSHASRVTLLADFFSILLRWSFPGRMKRVVVDQFLVCGEIIGFNGEVVLIERLWAGRGTEIRTIQFSLLFRGEPAKPVFRHPG